MQGAARRLIAPAGGALAALALLAAACGSSPGSSHTSPATSATTSGASAAPTIHHVAVINLENEGFDSAFGPSSPAPYLAHTLTSQGELLTQYYAIGHASADNYIAEISGQAPNPNTQDDCATDSDFSLTGTAAYGQAVGRGCVYPASVKTIADQLDSAGLTWKSYQEDMGNAAGEAKTCAHPPLGGADPTFVARPGDAYTSRHNPFVYFHSIIDSPVCNADVVPLTDLPGDLASAKTTPNLVFISPNLCHTGHDAPCRDGEPGGLTSANTFLHTWVPKLLSAPAFRENGLVVITFDEADSADASACCNEMPGPNVTEPGLTGPGGGRVGAVLLGPAVRPGSANATPYNHYSLLCSIENIFGLPHLGFASQPGLPCFSTGVYNNKAGR